MSAPTAIVVHAEDPSLAVYRDLDGQVDAAEGDGIMARWRFGRELLAERIANGGNQLPHGRLEEVSKAIGKKEREIRYRVQFAALYDTEEKVGTAVLTFSSWNEIREHLAVKGIRSSRDHEWYTPPGYLEAARAVLGTIDLDPASSHHANRTVGATTIYTADDDGLSRPWYGNVWLNPPYGTLTGQFIARLVDHYHDGDVLAAIALVNAHCTDTDWFQPLWDHTLCFTDHRIDFDAADRPKTSSSTHGSVFAYLGPDIDGFGAAFAPFGAVVRRLP